MSVGAAVDGSRLETLVAEKLGIELSRYSRVSVDLLVTALSRVPAEDAEARIRLLIGTFSIGETCFMRHAEQFDTLRKLVRTIPSMRGAEPLRVWSAGCATGEETYSLHAVLSQELGAYPLEVLGSDVNPEFLTRARKGRYRPWSLRGVIREDVQSWLEVSPEGATVAPRLIERTQFRAQNLVSDPFPAGLHVVFCRNVLMYFHPAAARRVFVQLSEVVEPGGLLFIGYSDPAPPADGLWVKEQLGGVRYFRRAFSSSFGVVAPPTRVRQTTPRAPESRAEVVPVPRPVVAPLSDPQKDTAFEPMLDVDTHVRAALLADEAGDASRALEAARRASLLAPRAALPHFLMARAFTVLGEPRRAAIHVQLARASLAQMPDTDAALEHAQGLTALQLTRMIHAAYG